MIFNSSNHKKSVQKKPSFQDKTFAVKLEQARNFKRSRSTSALLPSNGGKFSLKSVLIILSGLIVLGLAIWFAYFPNMLSIQAVNVQGLSESENEILAKQVWSSLKSKRFWLPKHNIFLVQNNFFYNLAISDDQVYKVAEIAKDYKLGIVTIKVEPKFERYQLLTESKIISLFNDTSFRLETALGDSKTESKQWLNLSSQNIVKLVLSSAERISTQNIDKKQRMLSSELQEEIEFFANSDFSKIKSSLRAVKLYNSIIGEAVINASSNSSGITNEKNLSTNDFATDALPFAALPLNSHELTLVFAQNETYQSEYKVLVDAKKNSAETVKKLELLINTLGEERFKNLDYIDLRLDGRGFACLKNTDCSR